MWLDVICYEIIKDVEFKKILINLEEKHEL